MISHQLLNRFKSLRLPVLYHMPLVQYTIVPSNTAEEVDILSYYIVRRDDKVVVFDVAA